MATVLEECISEEQCSVMRFLGEKGHNAKHIHNYMFPVYGGKCLSRKPVHNWVKKFSEGRFKVTDEHQSGHPVEIKTEATVQQLIGSIVTALRFSHGLAYSIMHGCLMFWKVCT
jgi:hypothetical protein